MDEILKEVRELRAVVQELKLMIGENEESGKCEGLTGKGTRCKNGAVQGEKFCKMHGKEKIERVKNVKKKEPKVKKVQPEHTHGEGMTCRLCETHGDVLDENMLLCQFE
jgi:hypothetical protein